MYAVKGMKHRIVLQKESLLLFPVDRFGYVYRRRQKKYIHFTQIASLEVVPNGLVSGMCTITLNDPMRSLGVLAKTVLIPFKKSEKDDFLTLLLYWDGYTKNKPLDFDTLSLYSEQSVEDTSVALRAKLNKGIMLTFFIAVVIMVITMIVIKLLRG